MIMTILGVTYMLKETADGDGGFMLCLFCLLSRSSVSRNRTNHTYKSTSLVSPVLSDGWLCVCLGKWAAA